MGVIASMIEKQQRIAQQIRDLQAEEKELRITILDDLFGKEDQVGTVKTVVGNLVVTGGFGLTYKFNQEQLDEALSDGVLSEEAANLIRVTYGLDKKAFDNASKEVSEEIMEYLTVSPALPTLKVKAEADGD